MQMHEVGEVTQVVGATNANNKLAQGWLLLAVTSAGNGNNDGGSYVWYVLGKPKQATPAPLGSLVGKVAMKE